MAVGVVAVLAAGLVLVTRDSAAPDSPGTVAAPVTEPAAAPAPTTTSPAAEITLAFAGDVHFAGRVRTRLDDPATAFWAAATALRAADLTMVNLETAITERGAEEPKTFTFRAPATAFAALRAAGVDVATMANNHAADFGPVGLADTLGAIRGFPVVGIGATARQAYAPYYTTVRGHRVALLAASQIRDRTLSAWSATDTGPGIASAYDDRLVAAVRAARSAAEIVVVYLHWGVRGRAARAASSARWRRGWPTPGRMRSSARTRTSCRARVTWGGPSSRTGWATTCGGGTRPSPTTPACSG